MTARGRRFVALAAAGFLLATVLGAAASADVAAPPERTLRDWYAMGGWVMHLLAACSVLAVAIALERAVALRAGAVAPRRLAAELRALAEGGDLRALVERCTASRTPLAGLARLGAEAWERHGDRRAAEEALEAAAGAETARLGRNLSLLASVGNLSTLLGLLGTVLGMIDAFETIAARGSSDATVVAGGIFRALVTTAAGLAIGIFAFALHALLRRRVEGWTERLEDALTDLLGALPAGSASAAGARSEAQPSEVGREPLAPRVGLAPAEAP